MRYAVILLLQLYFVSMHDVRNYNLVKSVAKTQEFQMLGKWLVVTL